MSEPKTIHVLKFIYLSPVGTLMNLRNEIDSLLQEYSLDTPYEFGEDGEIKLKSKRPETKAEQTLREKQEAQERRAQAEAKEARERKERKEYERLKAKFEGKV